MQPARFNFSWLPFGGLVSPFWHPGGTILAPREHIGGPWEQQDGREGVRNRTSIDFEMILGVYFESFLAGRVALVNHVNFGPCKQLR